MTDIRNQNPEVTSDFLASHGGPFYELQHRLRLLHEHALKTGQRALIFITLAWFIPLLLGLPQSLSLDTSSGLTYLADLGVWSKFFIAVGAFVLSEQQIEKQLRKKLRQVISAPIIAPTSFTAAAHAVNQALQQRNSKVAEIICLVIAILAAMVAIRHQYTVETSSWAVVASPAGNTITFAGWWTLIVSVPLFWFLALRGVWRHFVWSILLRKIAQMELRLVSTHPDGKGGIGFLADYPNAYMTFVFGISCAVAAAVAKNVLQETPPISHLTMLMGGWLVIVLALFAYPLSAFSKPLAELKKATMTRLTAQATQFQRLTERKLMGSNVVADSASEAEEVQDVTDPGKQYDATRKLSTLLLNRSALLPVSAAALFPFAIVAATRVPFKEVMSLVKKLLLL
ncbi:hypothetical protein ASE23_28295 [Rhizobium sp. Root73]|uniref:hypothetical protein n=1 Tax=unclassified Rhizobium TaxID=2613769 RepID=UPI00072B8F0C|nr:MULTISPECIES: hypothetical protein [unclassified Rhizobium]KQY12164.1 hypothetical protein ASD36_28240 [Rhizobium sp. Root1334]KRC03985.1 hypothetical protein ASE23_28295 [Rhizobium sp. Root73]